MMKSYTEYGDIHRYFLRSMLSHGVMKEPYAEKILCKYADTTAVDLNQIVTTINKEIKPLQQKIKVVKNEYTGFEEVVFIWTGDDEASRSQGKYSKSELEYFKYILEELITSDSKSITGMTVLNLVSKVESQPLSKVQAQKLLENWCAMHYLKEVTPENYFLGTKGIHEFEHYFKTHYSDFTNSCNICKNLVFRAHVCPSCNEYFHVHCLKHYFDSGSTRKCPKCKKSFNYDWLQILEKFDLSDI